MAVLFCVKVDSEPPVLAQIVALWTLANMFICMFCGFEKLLLSGCLAYRFDQTTLHQKCLGLKGSSRPLTRGSIVNATNDTY